MTAPMLGMPRSAVFAAAARLLEEEARRLAGWSNESHQHWDDLFFDLRGPAPDALRDRLLETATQWDASQTIMAQVATLLWEYVPVVRLAETLADEPLGTAAGHFGTTVGRALDFLCARQIEALCTQADPPPPRRLDDFGDLDIDAIHQLNLDAAPPHIRTLSEHQPDLRLLEASEHGIVAMVPPPGSDPHWDATAPASVTTFVPGVGSADPGTWPGSIDRARALAKATGGPAIAWLGYEAPANLQRAVHRGPAQAGARDLDRFQQAVARRWPAAQRVVVGYSYGSVVVGHAQDLRADDIVFVGSPGVGRMRAADFGARVWAATNADDPIGLATGPLGGIHGLDPAGPTFGARALPGAANLPGGHSDYWDDPEFLAGMGRITGARPRP